MVSFHRGKLIILYSTLAFAISLHSRVLGEITENKHDEVDAFCVLDRHQAQLERLEEIVKSLSELVSRLDSRLSSNERFDNKIEEKPKEVNLSLDFENEAKKESDLDVRDIGGAAPVVKYDPFWSEKFQFVSAVRLNADATSINVLPFRDHEGVSKYFAVGDNRGRVYIFLKDGDVAVEFATSSDSPVTAMLSYFSIYKNDSVLVTGHENGLILVHRVWETSNGEDLASVYMENSRKIGSGEIGLSSIALLEVHYVGRMRYILSTDSSGKLRIFRESGELYSSIVPTSRPIAFLKQRLLFLTETGAGSLDLRTMKIKESECEGLNDSYVENYVFDATERSKAYGFTNNGDLVHVLLLGDSTNFKCRVRSKKKIDIEGPLSIQAMKGYLLIVNLEKVYVYNVSSQHHYLRAGSPRLLFSAGLNDIRSCFTKDSRKGSVMIPLLASDKEKLVILGLGGGYVGTYRSNLPIFKGEFNTMLWSSPILIFILFLFVAWHFFSKKKEALTSWGPDDTLGSTTGGNGAPPIEASTRNGEMTDMRSGGLRGPTRRYGSPTRYANSFRPTPGDANPRPPPVDPNVRAASELKYRGSNVESSAGYQKRRDNLFGNNQVVDDSS